MYTSGPAIIQIHALKLVTIAGNRSYMADMLTGIRKVEQSVETILHLPLLPQTESTHIRYIYQPSMSRLHACITHVHASCLAGIYLPDIEGWLSV